MNIKDLMLGVIDGLEERREARAREASSSNASGSTVNLASTSRSRKRRHESASSPPPSSSPPYVIDPPALDGLDDYLKLCGCSQTVLVQYKEKFAGAGITNFRLINADDTPLTKMAELGFPEAVAKMMYKNAAKHVRKIAKRRRAE